MINCARVYIKQFFNSITSAYFVKMTSSSSVQNAAVERVSVKVPPFWKTNPKLWFSQIESQFFTSKITVDATKFHTVVAAVESSILSQVSDIIINPPAERMYDTLKERLILQYSDSEQKRLKTLLMDIELGDKKPSTLLREMRDLSGGGLTDEMLKSLWLQRLPQQQQAILSVKGTDDVTNLATLADKINEVGDFSQSNIAETSSARSNSNIDKQIAELSKQVAELRNAIHHQSRPRSTSNQRNRQRSSSRSKPSSEYCWYHSKFGVNASECKKPCNFQPSENGPAQR